MSEDVPSKKKERKALRDAERQRKGKKRKHAKTVEPADSAKDFIPLETGDDTVIYDVHAVKAPKLKKRKRSEEDIDPAADSPVFRQADGPVEEATAKRKKRRKAKKAPAVEGEQGAPSVEDATPTEKVHKSRFILFIGNLPFGTTDASLQAHFKKLSPFTLRHRTDPQTKKSKGFAFLEFENYDRMETCLKKYHHTMFDPDDYREAAGKFGVKEKTKGKKRGGRQINVELTAGGGGKGDARKEKIREKNVHLEEERQRRSEQEALERAESARTGGAGLKHRAGRREEATEAVGADHTAGMHPSRLTMIKS